MIIIDDVYSRCNHVFGRVCDLSKHLNLAHKLAWSRPIPTPDGDNAREDIIKATPTAPPTPPSPVKNNNYKIGGSGARVCELCDRTIGSWSALVNHVISHSAFSLSIGQSKAGRAAERNTL